MSRISASGTITLLHVFADGDFPRGRLVAGGDGNYYGTSGQSVYRIGPDGSFAVVHLFQAAEGTPGRRLAKSAGGTIYGVTFLPYPNNDPAFFAIEPDGTFRGGVFTVAGATDVFAVDADGTLYGIAGCCDPETWQIYRRATDGSISTLHDFGADADPVTYSQFDIGVAVDGTLFGLFPSTGSGGNATCSIFRLGAEGYRTVRTLGFCPYDSGGPLLFEGADGYLYGHGLLSWEGDLFRISRSGAYELIHQFSGEDGLNVSDFMQTADGRFVGTTSSGGTLGGGTAFSVTLTDEFATLVSFPRGNADGRRPEEPLLAVGNDFYGTTSAGGPADLGTIFRVSRTGTLTTLYTFTGRGDGGNPSRLVLGPDGLIYGTTSGGYGLNLQLIPGTFFRISPSGTLTTIYVFPSVGFGGPGPLMLASDGFFYSWTTKPGAWGGNETGSIIRLSTAGAVDVVRAMSSQDALFGGFDMPLVQGADGNLYGTTRWTNPYGDGQNKFGTVFVMNLAGVILFQSDFVDGWPELQRGRDGKIYGTYTRDGPTKRFTVSAAGMTILDQVPFGGYTSLKGQLPDGSWFGFGRVSGSLVGVVRLAPDGAVTVLHQSNDFQFYGGYTAYIPTLVDGGDGQLYGMTNSGGYPYNGIVFKVSQSGPFSSPTSDYDGDGKSDLVVYNRSTGIWQVRQSSGANMAVQWGVRTDIPVPGDYDGDGVPDIAVFRPSAGIWYVLTSSSQFTQWYFVVLGRAGDIPVPQDYDGDGVIDMAVFHPSTAEWTYRSSIYGGDQSSVQFGQPGDIPVPADYDGVGYAEMAVFRRGTWSINSPYPIGVRSVGFGAAGDVPVPADYTRTGHAQLALYRPSTSIWFVADQFMMQFGAVGDLPVPQDLDGDGRAELVVFDPSTGVWSTLNTLTGERTTLALGAAGDIPAVPAWLARPTAGDHDGDRRADLTLFRPSDGTWWSAFSSTDFATYDLHFWGAPGDLPLTGDFLGTGHPQRAVFRAGTWWIEGGGTPFVLGAAGDIPVPADYDGDGITDAAVFRNGVWTVRLSSAPDAPPLVVAFGLPGDIPAPGDYDGDGKADFVVFRNGDWYLQYSSPTGTFSYVRWGLPGDVPVVADYDGDGRSDVAIYRPSDGTWIIRRSSDGYPSTYVFGGAAGDVPVPADYDGDGRAEVAIFRSFTSIWFTGAGSVVSFGAPGDIPIVPRR